MRRIFNLVCATIFCWASSTSTGASAPLCKGDQGYTAADFSMPVDKIRLQNGKPGLDVLVKFGVRTIIRYYDYDFDSDIPEKILTRRELNEIFKRKGMYAAVIFQYQGYNPRTYLLGDRGREDAREALRRAQEVSQPFGTAIFFGLTGRMTRWKILSPSIRLWMAVR